MPDPLPFCVETPPIIMSPEFPPPVAIETTLPPASGSACVNDPRPIPTPCIDVAPLGIDPQLPAPADTLPPTGVSGDPAPICAPGLPPLPVPPLPFCEPLLPPIYIEGPALPERPALPGIDPDPIYVEPPVDQIGGVYVDVPAIPTEELVTRLEELVVPPVLDVHPPPFEICLMMPSS